jgi:hypothetical protein
MRQLAERDEELDTLRQLYDDCLPGTGSVALMSACAGSRQDRAAARVQRLRDGLRGIGAHRLVLPREPSPAPGPDAATVPSEARTGSRRRAAGRVGDAAVAETAGELPGTPVDETPAPALPNKHQPPEIVAISQRDAASRRARRPSPLSSAERRVATLVALGTATGTSAASCTSR